MAKQNKVTTSSVRRLAQLFPTNFPFSYFAPQQFEIMGSKNPKDAMISKANRHPAFMISGAL
jgi:hypothetical protein